MNAFVPPGPSGPAPSPWTVAKAADGREYYHNTMTNKTQWEKPEELMTDEERSIIGTQWQIYDSNGRKYWAHKQTRETTWDMPDDVRQNLERIKSQRAPPPTLNGWPKPPPFDSERQRDREPRDRERDTYQPMERRDRDRDRESGYGADRSSMAFVASTELHFSSPQEAEAAFKKVLKQLKIQPDWTWSQAVRAGIKDPNWRAIPEPEKRQGIFKDYCEELRELEKSKELDRRAKLRTDFEHMLRSHPEIKHYTRWKTAYPLLEDETIFRSAKDDGERRTLFEEYITRLKREHQRQQDIDKETANRALRDLLQGLELEPFTRFRDAEEQLSQMKEFASGETFRPLHRLDVLKAFESHIRQLQREHNDRVQLQRRQKRRVERKSRDAFKQLLKELQVNGRIRFDTKWKDVHALIKDDSRYIAMLGQSGSSPLDLFWDVVEVEEHKFRTQRRYALDVLEHERFEVTTTTPFDDFLTVMRTDPRTASNDDQTMKSIFDYIIAKVKKREEGERRDEEHHERHAMDNLRSVIKRLDPPVTVADSWEAVRSRVEKTEEYRALKSDSLRQSVFDKYIRRLKEKESDRRDRSRRDPDDRYRERDRRDRYREYRNGHSETHQRHRTRTRSPEHDSYAAERRQAQQDREARYRNTDSTGLSPPYRRGGDIDRWSRRGSGDHYGDHYGRERREREAERERSYIRRGDPLSRADPRDRTVGDLDYGDSGGRSTSAMRRRRESDASTTDRRDNKRARHSPRHDRKSTPRRQKEEEEEDTARSKVKPEEQEERALRSGSEEGEIEED